MAKPTAELTPMQRQYQAIKEQNKDCILFFRLGDFYEMFNEDAQLAARELDLTLTSRDRSKPKEEQTPMCSSDLSSCSSSRKELKLDFLQRKHRRRIRPR